MKHRCEKCSALVEGRCGCTPTRQRPGDRHRNRASAWTRGYNATYQQHRARIIETHPPCYWCGDPATTADHLTPLAEGGTNDVWNLAPACARCNSRRGGQQNR